MANEYVSEGYKDRLRIAARAGRNDGQCHVSQNSQMCQIFHYFHILILGVRVFFSDRTGRKWFIETERHV